MDRETMKQELIEALESGEEYQDYDGNHIKGAYLGTYMALDPCGRYHHALSPNGATDECLEYWETLEECADEIGAYITSGEGDPCDIYIEQVID